MTNEYELNTKKNWLETRNDIMVEMRRWGISDYLIEKAGATGAKVTYIKDGKTIDLVMDRQAASKDNLRVLFLAIQALRLNEVRGISDVVASAYMQLPEPLRVKDPYDVLGLPRGTAPAVCEAQFRELAKKLHPDVGGDPVRFKELNDAIEQIREDSKNG